MALAVGIFALALAAIDSERVHLPAEQALAA
jgi:hypothetical protein